MTEQGHFIEGLPVQPELDISISFLMDMRRRGPWTLTAIRPDQKGAPTETFIGEHEINDMRDWIEDMNKSAGVYFCANPTRFRMRKRPREEDMLAFQYAALDFDPCNDESPAQCRDRVLTLLRGYRLKPTFVWSSGNGIQAMWRVKPAIMLREDKATITKCKKATLGLIRALGSDSTQSLEHLFRVPGTINYPNKSKRAAGRTPIFASGFFHGPKRIYTLKDFPTPKNKLAAEARGLSEPPGGWDTQAGINDAILYFQTTKDVAAEGRSGTAIRTARRARDFGVSPETAFELMWEYWVPRCEYPWDSDELESKVHRAYQGAENDPGCSTIEYRQLIAKADFLC